MNQKTRMYADVKTWNPFKGCLFDCIYCIPSFQLQAKRQMHNCMDCYNYVPHYHPERLKKIPSAETIFVCGNGDIAFSRADYIEDIIQAIKDHNKRRPNKTYYFQSKRPECLKPFVDILPENAIILTTLETNRDEGYEKISKAPKPSERYRQFRELDYPRKVITIEPMADFDLDIFSGWIKEINPEYVWLGYNSRPKQIDMPEPDTEKVLNLIIEIQASNIKIKGKELRDIQILDIETEFET